MKKSHKNKKSKSLRNNNALKSLHGALRSLLDKQTTSNGQLTKKSTSAEVHSKKQYPKQKNDVIYIRSKENMLIPKLTDDEVMQRHKKADENMKNVWTNIIAKYEAMDDSKGDLIDLTNSEIIEDNGHVRGLSDLPQSNTGNTRYISTLTDILPNNNLDIGSEQLDQKYSSDTNIHERQDELHNYNENSIWADTDNSSDKSSIGSMSDEYQSGQENDSPID